MQAFTDTFNQVRRRKEEQAKVTQQSQQKSQDLKKTLMSAQKEKCLEFNVREGNKMFKTIVQEVGDGGGGSWTEEEATRQLNMKLIAVVDGIGTSKFKQKREDGRVETD